MSIATFIRTGIALTSLCFGMLAQAVQPLEIKALSPTDRHYMSQQRALLDDLARSHLGRQLRREKANDLAILQLLLDRQLVRGNQTKELQAMGVVMGDHLAEELKMHWVIYEDKMGRSRALRYKDSDHYLFPITMISRRREADNQARVTDIYQKAVAIIQPKLPPAPYQ